MGFLTMRRRIRTPPSCVFQAIQVLAASVSWGYLPRNLLTRTLHVTAGDTSCSQKTNLHVEGTRMTAHACVHPPWRHAEAVVSRNPAPRGTEAASSLDSASPPLLGHVHSLDLCAPTGRAGLHVQFQCHVGAPLLACCLPFSLDSRHRGAWPSLQNIRSSVLRDQRSAATRQCQLNHLLIRSD